MFLFNAVALAALRFPHILLFPLTTTFSHTGSWCEHVGELYWDALSHASSPFMLDISTSIPMRLFPCSVLQLAVVPLALWLELERFGAPSPLQQPFPFPLPLECPLCRPLWPLLTTVAQLYTTALVWIVGS